MIGMVGTLLGEADVNISSMQVGRSGPRGHALMLLSVDDPIPPERSTRAASSAVVLTDQAPSRGRGAKSSSEHLEMRALVTMTSLQLQRRAGHDATRGPRSVGPGAGGLQRHGRGHRRASHRGPEA